MKENEGPGRPREKEGGRFGVRNPPQGLNIYRVLMFRVKVGFRV